MSFEIKPTHWAMNKSPRKKHLVIWVEPTHSSTGANETTWTKTNTSPRVQQGVHFLWLSFISCFASMVRDFHTSLKALFVFTVWQNTHTHTHRHTHIYLAAHTHEHTYTHISLHSGTEDLKIWQVRGRGILLLSPENQCAYTHTHTHTDRTLLC